MVEVSHLLMVANGGLVIDHRDHHRSDDDHQNVSSLWSLRSLRLRIALLLAVAATVFGLMRLNMSMAMVCMVKRPPIETIDEMNNESELFNNVSSSSIDHHHHHKCALLSLFREMNKTEEDLREEGRLEWSVEAQSRVFTALYLGGLAVILPGGVLCQRFGAKRAILIGAILNVLGSLSTPLVAVYFGVWWTMAIRFIMGCGQGLLGPGISIYVAEWFPNREKSTALAISSAGNQISAIGAMYFTSILCQIRLLDGWPFAFYVYGLMGALFCCLWLCLSSDSPSNCQRLSDQELIYITGTRSSSHRAQHQHQRRSMTTVPWTSLFTSSVVWANCGCAFSQTFIVSGFTVYLPIYYRTLMRLDLSSNGVMSAIPFIAQLLFKALFAGIASWMKHRQRFSDTCVTKAFNLIASFGTATCFFLLTFCDCEQRGLAVILACLTMGMVSAYIPGYNTSIVSIAPAFTATVASMSRFWAQIGAALSPFLIGWLTREEGGSLSEWRLVFYSMMLVSTSTGLLFQVFGSASEQSWSIVPKVESVDHQLLSTTFHSSTTFDSLLYTGSNSTTQVLINGRGKSK